MTATGGSGARNFDVVITNVRIPIYIVITSASPPEGGTTSGSGVFTNASTDTVNATPNTGYRFVNWTEDGSVVSTSASYTFTGSSDRALVANFSILRSVATPTISPPGGHFSHGQNVVKESGFPAPLPERRYTIPKMEATLPFSRKGTQTGGTTRVLSLKARQAVEKLLRQ